MVESHRNIPNEDSLKVAQGFGRTTQEKIMRTRLESFDQKYQTLIDYFCIIGYDIEQLKTVIGEINS